MPDTFSHIYLHYVFAVKYRRALIWPHFENRLYKYMTGIVQGQNQTLIRINGMPDHVHLLVRLRPAMSPSKLVQLVKQNSSKWINENQFCHQRFNWQRGGAIFSVGPSQVPSKIKYIENQKYHHGYQSFKDEYLDLLVKHNIDFKDEFLLEFFEELY